MPNIGANKCKVLLNSDKADWKLVIHSKSCIQSFVFHVIPKKEVTRHINAMKTHTAPGLDGISSKFIKLAKFIVALPVNMPIWVPHGFLEGSWALREPFCWGPSGLSLGFNGLLQNLF